MIVQSIFARIGIVVVVVVLAFGAGWLRGHNRGWDSATTHYTAVVNAAMTANAKDAATITQLQEANAAFAGNAAAEKARADKAEQDLKAQQRQSAEALAQSEKRLNDAIREHGDAHAWGVEPVPPSVAGVLRQ